MAIIFAWTGCLKKRGELDGTPEVSNFAAKLEASALETIENGTMTGDLVNISTQGKDAKPVLMEAFFDAVKAGLESKLGSA